MSRLSQTEGPFVIIDGAPNRGARIFRNPRRIIEATSQIDLQSCLRAMKAETGAGHHLAGYMSYGPGQASFGLQHVGDGPLLWFGVFDDAEIVDRDHVGDLLPEDASSPRGLTPRITFEQYAAAFARVKKFIAAGDVYQVNLTFGCDVAFEDDPPSVFAMLRGRAQVPHGGLVWTGRRSLVSLSPELFFDVRGGFVTSRPMKGTAVRGDTETRDRQAAATLASDGKQRAENLMIVDLMRNDLARLSRAGSVKVPYLFAVETYPTVHQLTSTVESVLLDGVTAHDLLLSAFPCGSVTGAPKRRAMEIIDELEFEARGAYCGSIGWIDPAGDATFNVAIRTLEFVAGSSVARLGLGSAIVTDSEVHEEWLECLAKARFLGLAAARRAC